jgi:hypothetical protein
MTSSQEAACGRQGRKQSENVNNMAVQPSPHCLCKNPSGSFCLTAEPLSMQCTLSNFLTHLELSAITFHTFVCLPEGEKQSSSPLHLASPHLANRTNDASWTALLSPRSAPGPHLRRQACPERACRGRHHPRWLQQGEDSSSPLPAACLCQPTAFLIPLACSCRLAPVAIECSSRWRRRRPRLEVASCFLPLPKRSQHQVRPALHAAHGGLAGGMAALGPTNVCMGQWPFHACPCVEHVPYPAARCCRRRGGSRRRPRV